MIFFRSFTFFADKFLPLTVFLKGKGVLGARMFREIRCVQVLFGAKMNSEMFSADKPSNALYYLTLSCGCGQVVRQKLPKLSFAGSSPVTRSKYMQAADGFPSAAFCFQIICSKSCCGAPRPRRVE